jgi:hypothetical protein
VDKTTCFHEDVFYEYFRPFRHPAARFDIWGSIGLETFGDDFLLAREYAQEYVWTVVDASTDQWIIPGLHHVNRVCYLLTEIPHSDASIEFDLLGRSLHWGSRAESPLFVRFWPKTRQKAKSQTL